MNKNSKKGVSIDFPRTKPHPENETATFSNFRLCRTHSLTFTETRMFHSNYCLVSIKHVVLSYQSNSWERPMSCIYGNTSKKSGCHFPGGVLSDSPSPRIFPFKNRFHGQLIGGKLETRKKGKRSNIFYWHLFFSHCRIRSYLETKFMRRFFETLNQFSTHTYILMGVKIIKRKDKKHRLWTF